MRPFEQTGRESISLPRDHGRRHREAADLRVRRREAKARFWVRRKAAVYLHVLCAAFERDGGVDRQVGRFGKNNLNGSDAVRPQQFLSGLVAGKVDIQVVFGNPQGAEDRATNGNGVAPGDTALRFRGIRRRGYGFRGSSFGLQRA